MRKRTLKTERAAAGIVFSAKIRRKVYAIGLAYEALTTSRTALLETSLTNSFLYVDAMRNDQVDLDAVAALRPAWTAAVRRALSSYVTPS